MRKRLLMALLLSAGPLLSPMPSLATTPDIEAVTMQMQSSAEALVDAIMNKDLSVADNQFRALEESLARLHRLTTDEAFDERRTRELIMSDAWMQIIAIDLQHQAWTGAAIAANQMCGESIRFARFASNEPRDMTWTGYVCRDLMLTLMEGRPIQDEVVQLRNNQLVHAWQRLHGDLIQQFGNKPLVLRGDALILKISKERDEAALIELCKSMLQLLGEIRSQNA